MSSPYFSDCVPPAEGGLVELAKAITPGSATREDVIGLIANNSQQIRKVYEGLVTPCIEVLNANDALMEKAFRRIRKVIQGGASYSGKQLDFVLQQLHSTLLNKTVENGIRLQNLQTSILLGEIPEPPASYHETPTYPGDYMSAEPPEGSEEIPSMGQEEPQSEPAGVPPVPIPQLPPQLAGIARERRVINAENPRGMADDCCDALWAIADAMAKLDPTIIFSPQFWMAQFQKMDAKLNQQQELCPPKKYNPKTKKMELPKDAPFICKALPALGKILFPPEEEPELSPNLPEPDAFNMPTWGESALTDMTLQAAETQEESTE